MRLVSLSPTAARHEYKAAACDNPGRSDTRHGNLESAAGQTGANAGAGAGESTRTGTGTRAGAGTGKAQARIETTMIY